MTPSEAKGLLERALALWAWEPIPRTLKALGTEWAETLAPVDHQEALAALRRLSGTGGRMPTPTQVAMEASGAPDPYEAWAQVRDRAEAANSGREIPVVHPVAAEAVRRLGGSAHLGTTNGDRDAFVQIYRKALVASLA